MDHDMRQPSRRIFLKSIGATTAAGAALGAPVASGAQADACARPGAAEAFAPAYTFLLPDEVAFVEAAIDVFIPNDDVGPGGVESGVCYFIDQQLAGAYGIGGGTNLQGPFEPGTPTQGYQLPFTPQQIYRIGIRDTDAHCAKAFAGKSFAALSIAERDTVLRQLQTGGIALATVPARLFLSMLHTNAMEGYFADPAYGGNRGKAVWKMLGFPGVGYVYADDIRTFRGKRQTLEPQSLADFR